MMDAKVVRMTETALVGLEGRFGTRYDARIDVEGLLVDLSALKLHAIVTVFFPRKASNGKCLRRDAKAHRAAVACMKAAIATAVEA